MSVEVAQPNVQKLPRSSKHHQTNEKPSRKSKVQRPSMEVAINSKYDIINRIGSGSVGTVFQVIDHANSRLHALKVVRKSDLTDSLAQLSIRRETTALRRFRHPNIIRFHHAFEDVHFIYVATEYCSRGDLMTLLRRTSLGLPELDSLKIMRQVFQALAYLHSYGVSHRDVKLENVLLAPDGSVRLADLGLVHWRKPDDARLSTRFCGTPVYAAPEVVKRKEYVPQFADMWACGITLYILLTRSKPSRLISGDNMSNRAINLNVIALLGSEELAHVHLHCRQLLERLLVVDAAKRISAKDAIALCDEALASRHRSSVKAQ